jgi:SAM-dependent methyltransferase
VTGVFGRDYADAYDLLYADKDYEAECDLLEDVFRGAGRPVRSVLDLGCGTGAHAVRLAARGYEVVGVDLSEGMLDGARKRAESAGSVELDLIQGDIRTVRLDRTFDAVICMFAVLGYQTSDADVAGALATVRMHLAPGGPFVFDVWYGPAVEATGPSARVKVIATVDGEVERQASASLNADAPLCTVSYRLTRRRPGEPDVVADETHRMRYFFRDEVERLLDAAGLRVTGIAPFPDTGTPLSTETWNVLVTAAG